MTQYTELYRTINYHFKDESLIMQALIHASHYKIKQHYIESERYEFLGDRILSLIMAEYLFRHFPHETEGQLAKRHAYLVSSTIITAAMNQINLSNFIRHDLKTRQLPDSIVGDIGEALIAALYLDGGLETTRIIVLNLWQKFTQDNAAQVLDPKSDLQAYAQKNFDKRPYYKLISTSGSDHQPLYTVSVNISDTLTAIGCGPSKKRAEREAALNLLIELQK